MFQCSLRLSNESPAFLPLLSSPASSASSHLSAPRAASDCCCLAAFGGLAGALYGCWSFGAAVNATRNQHVQPSARPVLLVPFRTVLPETFTVHGAAWVQNLWDEQTTPVPDRGEFKHRSTCDSDSCSLGKVILASAFAKLFSFFPNWTKLRAWTKWWNYIF